VRTIRGALDRLLLHWEAELRRLPFFTQRTAVVLLGVLVATLAMLGGVVALVGWPGANGPTRLVPGERAGRAPESRPEPGDRPAPGSSGAGVRSGADAGGATAAFPSPGGPAGRNEVRGHELPARGSRGAASGAQGSGGAAGAGAGGPPAAPPTTSPAATSPPRTSPPATSPPTTTTPPGPLDPVDELLGPVVSTLLP
jgi:hypothetical protein